MADCEYRGVLPTGPTHGRGAASNPGNRFETVHLHVLGEEMDAVEAQTSSSAEPGGCGQWEGAPPRIPTQVFHDQTQSIINRVDSPDLGMQWSLNPYRGCEHGCVYCYARPTHEYLGFTCGIDFETKIMAKLEAPALLRKELAWPKWKPEMIMMSGVTDCYQPIERQLRVTRGCLEVFAECRQPVGIVTKNRLVLRDLDLLVELAQHRAVSVAVSVTTLDKHLAAKMEPRASSPADRLHTIAKLREAGVPAHVMVAPVIPGLTDREMPAILQAASQAGAQSAGYVLLRLPYQLKELFVDWLNAHFPQRAGHVQSLLRDMRGGKLYDATLGVRRVGEGPIADQIGNTFRVFARRYGLDGPFAPLSGEGFRRPQAFDGRQLSLF